MALADYNDYSGEKRRLSKQVRDLKRALRRMLRSTPMAASVEGGVNVVRYTDVEWEALVDATAYAREQLK